MSRVLLTIPTWNEETVIRETMSTLLRRVPELLSDHHVTIEVADNGSMDGTREIVTDVFSRFPPYEGGTQGGLFVIDKKGKGLAIRSSWARHLDDADVLVFMDADLSADLCDLPRLIAPILRGEADLVCGSRFQKGARVSRSASRYLASLLYRYLQKVILNLPIQDAQCGFKAILSSAAREILPRCREDGWMFDSELLFFAAARGHRVKEIPITWIDARDPRRRSAIRLLRHGLGFCVGLLRIRKRPGG